MSNRELIRQDLKKIDEEYKETTYLFLIYLRDFLYSVFMFLLGFYFGGLYYG